MERADWHRTQGHRLVIVSASLGVYLRPIAERLRFDAVLATELEVGARRPPHRSHGGRERARPREGAPARRVDSTAPATPFVWAYGDSSGDRELWARADRAVRLGRRGAPRRPSEPDSTDEEAARRSGTLARMSEFLDTLAERVLVFDGAFGTWVQDQDLGPDDFGGAALEGCNEHLVLTRPDLIQQMHAEFFEVGVDAVETATFGAFALVLNEYDIADETYEINEQAARLAKEVAADFSTPDRPRFVIGSIGPGTRLPSLGQIAFAELRDDYEAKVDGLLAGGVDVLLIETVQDLLQGKAAIIGARRAMATAGRRRSRSWCRSRSRPPAACSSAPRSAPRSPRSRRCGPT